MRITGPDLRAERRRAEITVVDLAARMGISRQTVHAIERGAVVSLGREVEYRRALAVAIVAAQERIA